MIEFKSTVAMEAELNMIKEECFDNAATESVSREQLGSL